jgi:hypothetical protein
MAATKSATPTTTNAMRAGCAKNAANPPQPSTASANQATLEANAISIIKSFESDIPRMAAV